MAPWALVIPALVLAAIVLAIVLVLAAREVPAVRPWLVVGALGAAAMPVAILLHNVLSALIQGEEAVSFVVALAVAPAVVAVGFVGAARALLREWRDLGVAVALAAGGLALFAAYMVLILVVTTLAGGNPEWQGATDAIATFAATAAAVVGTLLAVLALARGRRRLAPAP